MEIILVNAFYNVRPRTYQLFCYRTHSIVLARIKHLVRGSGTMALSFPLNVTAAATAAATHSMQDARMMRSSPLRETESEIPGEKR